ncbi:MAG: photosynthetic complex putative assembly protein PuhB [Erythrobacter sp.]
MDLKREARLDDEILDGAPAPKAFGDPMGTPSAEEKVLWKGRPDVSALARTAFHTRSVGLYFLILVGLSAFYGNVNAAVVCTVLGLVAIGILHGLAWLSVRTTMYILTDQRLIMRIGMAIETRINVPLKQVVAADLRMRGNDHGDIALRLGGERLLGYALLWPHARPWRFAHPEPMLRALAEPQRIAELLTEACAGVAEIEENLIEIKDAARGRPQQDSAPAETELEGVPA